jgi:hypothetical protein
VSDRDPHVHVERTFHARGATRNLLASTFGLAADLPVSVTTGCGIVVAYAMTSAEPASVTCLACREHAHREHLRLADQMDRLGRMPGTTLDNDQADLVVRVG